MQQTLSRCWLQGRTTSALAASCRALLRARQRCSWGSRLSAWQTPLGGLRRGTRIYSLSTSLLLLLGLQACSPAATRQAALFARGALQALRDKKGTTVCVCCPASAWQACACSWASTAHLPRASLLCLLAWPWPLLHSKLQEQRQTTATHLAQVPWFSGVIMMSASKSMGRAEQTSTRQHAQTGGRKGR